MKESILSLSLLIYLSAASFGQFPDCDLDVEGPVRLELTTGIWASELEFALLDASNSQVTNGEILYGPGPWTDNTVYSADLCLEFGSYTLQLEDSYGDGWQGGVLVVYSECEGYWVPVLETTVPAGAFSATSLFEVEAGCNLSGCTHPDAWNFEPWATEDDGSCIRRQDNVERTAAWSNPSLIQNGLGGSYSDCEAFAQDEREYAIIGSTEGTHIIQITDPGQADEIHFLPAAYAGSGVTHRDYHVKDDLLYAVCDQGASTLQIFDLSGLPGAVSTVYDGDDVFQRAHNVFVDAENDLLYACSAKRPGYTSPLLVLDVSSPEAPVEVADLASILPGCHDIFVEADTAWVNATSNGTMVFDMNDLGNPELIGWLDEYPFAGTNHSGWWLSEDEIYVFADETHGSPLKVTDVSDLTDMQVVGFLDSETADNNIAHNLMIVDQHVFISYYHDGLQVFDISNPAAPSRIAWYDTFEPDYHSGYAGAWGVHAGLPSGKILISDVQSGLFVLELTHETLYLCPGTSETWNGLSVDAPGDWSIVLEDPVLGADIAWTVAIESEQSCIECEGDINGDGAVTVSDVLLLISEWACSVDCTADLNGNAVVDIGDLLILLTVFGEPC
jgi:choice-of-anchor B domain-containing protein